MSHGGILWYRMVSCILLWYGIAIIFSTIIATPKTSNGHPSLLFLIGASVEHRLYAMDVPLYLLCLLWGSLVVLVAFACIGGENHTLPPRRVAADDDLFDLAENGSAPPLATRYNEDDDDYESFDPYATMDAMDEEDWNDMEDVRVILEMNKHARAIKYMHDRKDWSRHVEMLLATNEFDQRFRMNIDEFNYATSCRCRTNRDEKNRCWRKVCFRCC